ncbi:MAG TPA: DUF3857 domain-containing protein [Puia sp.]|jgi:hypothetical protein|nr:DUF3857 domain-containing protein [Puia sp.]
MFLLFLLWGARCTAQDKNVRELSPVSMADFTQNSTSFSDSNNAIILADIGQIRFTGNEHGWFSYVFQRHRRVKILNKKAFDELATVRVELYHPSDDPQKLEKVTASTYNLENGQVTEVKLEKKDIYTDRMRGDWTEMRFTLPAVKEGSIIDYSYTVTSPYVEFLPTWQFQSERYPCLWSEMMVDIPQALFYTVVKQGVHRYAVDKGDVGGGSYRVGDRHGGWMIVDATVTKHHWVMKDIPAFQAEGFLFCPDNYVDKIDFQLAKTYNGEQYSDFFNSWKEVTERLMSKSNFGATLDDDDQSVTDCIHKAIAGGGDLAAQAHEIYYYLTRNFTCDDRRNMFISGNRLGDVARKHSGSVGDINLLLVAMLRKIGLKADPVVLTRREDGFNLATYPVLERLDYVIARVELEGKVSYLDAAHPKLGFGQLDGDCYNGHARIISRTDSGSVYFESDSLQERKTTVVFITATDKGPEGKWESTLGPQESYELREQVNEQGEKAYFKNIQTQYGEDVAISDGGIDSLEQPEEPVKVHYSFKLHPGEGEAKIYLSPFIGAGLRKNPFVAAERKYPIEMPYAADELYVFTMEIPDGYTVEEMPKSMKATLNGQDGTFDYLIGVQGGMIQLRCRLRLNKANFSPDDYRNLRDFYALVVQKEAETIVLKKS